MAGVLVYNRWQEARTRREAQRAFGSSHAEGVYAAMADGSVRLISYAVDPTVFDRLGNKNDGQTIPAGEL